MKVTVDAADEYVLENGSSITIPLTTGAHTIVFSSSIRQTKTDIDVTENMHINVKFNRASGEIDVSGYKTSSQNNTPNVSISVGGGFFKGSN